MPPHIANDQATPSPEKQLSQNSKMTQSAFVIKNINISQEDQMNKEEDGPKKMQGEGLFPAIDDHKRIFTQNNNVMVFDVEDQDRLSQEEEKEASKAAAQGSTSQTRVVAFEEEAAEQESMLVHQGAYGKLKQETHHDMDGKQAS